MSLEEKLAAVRDASAKRISPDRLAVMHDATERLRQSGIMDRVIKPGSQGAGLHAERPERQCGDAVGFAGVRSGADERVPRLLVTLLPA